MKLKFICPLLFVKDVKASKEFYSEILGQKVEADLGENVTFEGPFSIQKAEHITGIIFGDDRILPEKMGSENMELYFEYENIDSIERELKKKGIEFIHDVKEMPWAQKVLRIRDPDGHIVEIGEPIPVLIDRLKGEGMTLELISKKVGIPLEAVKMMTGQ
jgi:catechol 2,3-dioxygenase-like lactoylglutathione lyase family enzyme